MRGDDDEVETQRAAARVVLDIIVDNIFLPERDRDKRFFTLLYPTMKSSNAVRLSRKRLKANRTRRAAGCDENFHPTATPFFPKGT